MLRAAATSSTLLAFETPTELPMFAGFTKSGSPSSSTSAAAVDGDTRSSRSARQRACAIPCRSSTSFAIALSMLIAEPSTPDPT